MNWPTKKQYLLPLFLFMIIASIAFNVGTALASENLVKGSPANSYEAALDRDTDPVHITYGSTAGKYNVRVYAVYGLERDGGTIWAKPGVNLPASPSSVAFGLGMNKLDDPVEPALRSQSFDNMPRGAYNASGHYVEWKDVVFPEGMAVRLNYPMLPADKAAQKGAWNKGGATMFIFNVGWDASFPIYTEDPDGSNGGNALRRSGNTFTACGTGRIANN